MRQAATAAAVYRQDIAPSLGELSVPRNPCATECWPLWED